MISQRKNIPLVRVKGFEGPWELCTLGEHIEDYVEKTTVQNQYPVLTSSQNKGIVRQEDYFANRQVTTDSNIGYFVLPKGFFTYRSRSDNGVFKFNRNDIVDKGIISYFYPVFSIIEGDSDFYLKLLNTSITKQAMLQAEGTGQKVLSLRKFKSIKASVPSLAEQSAIGSLFRTLDYLLASYKDNLANYQSLKATMLSKMFPKAGHTVPEIRLDGFEGDWELLEINDLADDFQSGGTPKTNVQEYWNGNIPWIQSSDLETNCLFETKVQKSISEKGLKNSSAKIIPKDSIAVVTRVGVGKLAVMRHEYATSQDFLSFSNLKSNIEFTAYLLYRLLQKEVTQLQGTSIKGITKVELLSKKVLIPSLPEQQAIGAYFSNLDNLIVAHQEKISQLETLKKKLLQDMFI